MKKPDLRTVLQDFATLIKEQFVGIKNSETYYKEVKYALTKMKLCNICKYTDFAKLYQRYFWMLKPSEMTHWLEQFFHKLPTPWDELCEKQYPEYLEKSQAKDTLGCRISFGYKIITEYYLQRKTQK